MTIIKLASDSSVDMVAPRFYQISDVIKGGVKEFTSAFLASTLAAKSSKCSGTRYTVSFTRVCKISGLTSLSPLVTLILLEYVSR